MNGPLKVGEADYCYGLGDLILRVTAFVASDLPDPQWVTLRGVELTWNGREKSERQVLVRRSAIRQQAKP